MTYKLGTFVVKEGESVNITDPCFHKGTWYRQDINVVPGTYKVYYKKIQGRIVNLKAVNSAMTAEDRADLYTVLSNDIEVTSGLFGIFVDKPDYSPEEWLEMWDDVDNSPTTLLCSDGSEMRFRGGLIPISNGMYTVYVKKRNDQIYCMEVRFE